MTDQDTKSDTEEWSRMWASASFVGVLIIIGVPLWWKTTEVFRVALPYDKISAFDTDSHYIATELVVLGNDERTVTDVSARIEKAFENSDVIKLKITKQVLPGKLRSVLDTVAEESEAVEEVGTLVDLERHNTFYVVQRTPLFQDVWVGTERVAFFRDSKAAASLIEALNEWIYQPNILHGARSETGDRARQVRFPGGAGFHVVLSVVHPQPQKVKVEFDAAEAVEDYIGSFVDDLSDLHNFTLKSQWLYLLDFDFQPKKVMDNTPLGYHFAVRHERLHSLMTRLEERAATHVSALPAVNLALYVAPCDAAPLVIYDTNNRKVDAPVQAFMSPKWGGVVLASPTACDDTFRPPTALVMGTFLAQLRNLIGITDKVALAGGHMAALRAARARRWERDSLLRVRTLEHVASAERSLASLAGLLGEISYIVINEDVGASIGAAVRGVERARAAMRAGRLLGAYRSARAAFAAAEAAFMEPSLLALLYFPDDQKYAIYIPLFLPIMFPVILSLKNLVMWFRGKSIKEKAE